MQNDSIMVVRSPLGHWWSPDRREIYTGEDAKILDKLFGYEEEDSEI